MRCLRLQCWTGLKGGVEAPGTKKSRVTRPYVTIARKPPGFIPADALTAIAWNDKLHGYRLLPWKVGEWTVKEGSQRNKKWTIEE